MHGGCGFLASATLAKRPVRLARPRTHGFHPCDRGSNPLRGTIFLKPSLSRVAVFCWADFGNRKGMRSPGVRRSEAEMGRAKHESEGHGAKRHPVPYGEVLRSSKSEGGGTIFLKPSLSRVAVFCWADFGNRKGMRSPGVRRSEAEMGHAKHESEGHGAKRHPIPYGEALRSSESEGGGTIFLKPSLSRVAVFCWVDFAERLLNHRLLRLALMDLGWAGFGALRVEIILARMRLRNRGA